MDDQHRGRLPPPANNGGGGPSAVSADERFHRLVLLGPSRAGKTSLVRRILYDVFEPDYRPTVEEFHKRVFRVKDAKDPATELILNLEIIDTSGSPDFPAMKQLALQKGEGFVLVFSFDQPTSLDEVEVLRDAVRAMHPDAFILIVGNKTDLPAEATVIQRELADNVVSCDWELPFIGCSARTGSGVTRILEHISDVWGVESAGPPSQRRDSRRLSMPPVFGAHDGRRRSSVMRSLAIRKSCMVQ